MKQSFAYYKLKHITGIPHSHTGQAVVERANRTLEERLTKQQGRVKAPRDRLNHAV